jgi:hypothetical protein
MSWGGHGVAQHRVIELGMAEILIFFSLPFKRRKVDFEIAFRRFLYGCRRMVFSASASYRGSIRSSVQLAPRVEPEMRGMRSIC